MMKKTAEPQSQAPTSCGRNGHGAIMFLLGFISKRVINYTSKYNDDDEGYDDIKYYWIYIHTYTYSICIYMIHRNQSATLQNYQNLSFIFPSETRDRVRVAYIMHTIIFIHECVHYAQPTQFIARSFAASEQNAKLSLSFSLFPYPLSPISLQDYLTLITAHCMRIETISDLKIPSFRLRPV